MVCGASLRGSIAKPREQPQDRSVRRQARAFGGFNASSTTKRSVSNARRWIEAFRLSINCELMASRASTSRSAASAMRASASTAAKNAAPVFGNAGSSAVAHADHRAQAVESRYHLVEVLAHVAPRGRAFVRLASLRRVREHELVAGLDRLDALLQIVARRHRSTCQRFGSWCSSNSWRVIQPRIIARVNFSFSGRSAK